MEESDFDESDFDESDLAGDFFWPERESPAGAFAAARLSVL